MNSFTPVQVIGKNIDETWFKLLTELAQKGRKVNITSGSCAGDTRLEFDCVMGTIMEPIQYSDTGEKLSLAVTTPAGCPCPTSDKAIYEYFNNYLLNGNLSPNEHYRYATFITGGKYKLPKIYVPIGLGPRQLTSFEIIVPNQLQWCINHFCKIITNEQKEKYFNFENNHSAIVIGYPESNFAYDIPYSNEMERGTSPCLRIITMKMFQEDNQWYLTFYCVFRSWDIFNGWPENIGGISLLLEYATQLIEVQSGIKINVGPLNFFSNGLHVYGSILDAMKLKIGNSAFNKE